MNTKTPLDYFKEISAIPRASGNEAGMAAYLMAFGKAMGLSSYTDAHHNVFLKKEASRGRESEPPVLLQAHTDMVAEKNAGVKHDFATEGIELVFEGNILHAAGTTLGADDGFGVALILHALADDTLSHPPLECLFTASEEIGLLGATGFDYSHVSARRMVNLDSTGEREVIVGCCGGMRHDLSLPVETAKTDRSCFSLTLGGLCGGHSGEDIHKGRLNAHVVMGKLLAALANKTSVRLASLSGGDKDNAIPRECEAHFAAENGAAVLAAFPVLRTLAVSMIAAEEDKGLTLTLAEIPAEPVMSEADTAKVLSVLSLPNGVLEWKEGHTMPALSRNLARIRTEGGKLNFGFSSRCPDFAKIEGLKNDLDAFAAKIGGTTRHYAAYPGWESPADAPVVRDWQKAYRAVAGAECVPTVIHAGLECGIISGALPGLEAISVGGNIYDLHTPAERMELDSFARMAEVLREYLKIC